MMLGIIPVDLSNNWNLVEGLENATFYSKISEGGGWDGGTTTQAKRMPLDKMETEGNEQLTVYGIEIHLWVNLLNGKIPKYGDKIVMSGAYANGNPGFLSSITCIIARDIDYEGLQTRYKCTCMRIPG